MVVSSRTIIFPDMRFIKWDTENNVNFHLLKKLIPDFMFQINEKLQFWGYLLPLVEHNFSRKLKLSQSKLNMGPEHCKFQEKISFLFLEVLGTNMNAKLEGQTDPNSQDPYVTRIVMKCSRDPCSIK